MFPHCVLIQINGELKFYAMCIVPFAIDFVLAATMRSFFGNFENESKNCLRLRRSVGGRLKVFFVCILCPALGRNQKISATSLKYRVETGIREIECERNEGG